MLLYILAILIVIFSWFWFRRNYKRKKSNLVFSLVMIGVPILFHIFGMVYASIIHNPGMGFTSAYIMSFLYFNSLVILLSHYFIDYRVQKKKREG